MANLVKDYDLVLDIGYEQHPNIFLKNKEVIGIDIKEDLKKPENYTEVISCNAFDLEENLGGRKADAIVCGDMIEHVEDPIKLLRVMHKCLKDGGLLLIATPNPHSVFEFLLTVFYSKKYFYTEEHITLYPQRWMERMMNMAGFENVKMKTGGIPLPIIHEVWFPRSISGEYIAVGFKK